MPQSDNIEANIHLAPLREDAIPALADLWVAAWQMTMPAIDFEARRPWIETFLAAPAYRTMVAALGGAPVGFASSEGDILQQLVVAPNMIGRGVGTALLDELKGSRRCLSLDVNEANFRAIRFYEREGFRRVGSGINATSGLATWAMFWP